MAGGLHEAQSSNAAPSLAEWGLCSFFQKDRPQPARHLRIRRHSIYLPFALIRWIFESSRFHIIPSVAMELIQLADDHVG